MTSESVRKLEFFIGGTRRDLQKATRKLIDSVLEAKHIPSGMELWSSGIEPLLDDIARHLDRCDVHIIIQGARYGKYVDGKSVSFTEWEYQQSKDQRPILAYLLDDDEFEKERAKVVAQDPSESKTTRDLLRFRRALRKDRFCKTFKNTNAGIEELGKHCINSIHEIINEGLLSEDVGWLRADSLEIAMLRQISENKFLDRELRRMREFSIVGKRVTIDRAAKERQATVFWEAMMGPIRRHGYNNLFFESGSTLAYVSEAFEDFVLKNDPEPGTWCVRTNNVFTLLQLLLYTDVDVRRFPPFAPDPEDKYGAIFPMKWHPLQELAPDKPRKFHENEANEVEIMRKKLCGVGEKVLFLATASGWDLNHKEKHFRGPHVGSHPNMLFKRALFASEKPVVIFLTAEKLGDHFERRKCYPIFGLDQPLRAAIDDYPLALCVGFDQTAASPTRRDLKAKVRKKRNDPARIIGDLAQLGFDTVYARKSDDTAGAIIAANPKFAAALPLN